MTSPVIYRGDEETEDDEHSEENLAPPPSPILISDDDENVQTTSLCSEDPETEDDEKSFDEAKHQDVLQKKFSDAFKMAILLPSFQRNRWSSGGEPFIFHFANPKTLWS